jgi:hypothetical protein
MIKKCLTTAACASLLLLIAACARQAGQGAQTSSNVSQPESGVQRMAAFEPVLVSAKDTDAAEPALATAGDGTVFVAWVEHREGGEADVWLSHLDADAKPKGSPVRVNAKAGEATAWHGDPPTVAVAPDATVYVGWTARVAGAKHASTLYLSASRDGGRSFESQIKVNDDEKPAAHGMHSLAVSPDGRIYVAWLDERNVAPPPPTKPSQPHSAHKESNRELFFAARSRLTSASPPKCARVVRLRSRRARMVASMRVGVRCCPASFATSPSLLRRTQAKRFRRPSSSMMTNGRSPDVPCRARLSPSQKTGRSPCSGTRPAKLERPASIAPIRATAGAPSRRAPRWHEAAGAAHPFCSAATISGLCGKNGARALRHALPPRNSKATGKIRRALRWRVRANSPSLRERANNSSSPMSPRPTRGAAYGWCERRVRKAKLTAEAQRTQRGRREDKG